MKHARAIALIFFFALLFFIYPNLNSNVYAQNCAGWITCQRTGLCCDPPQCPFYTCTDDFNMYCPSHWGAEQCVADNPDCPEPYRRIAGPGCSLGPAPTPPPGATGTPTPTTRPPGNAGVRIRIMYDANKNTAMDDGDANFVEDPDIRSCDNLAPNYIIFKDIDSATINIENGEWILNHPTQCYPAGGADDPKYPWSIKSLSGLGTYSFSFSIPGYKLVNATANKCTVTSDTTASCDLSAGTQELTFLITDSSPTCNFTSGPTSACVGDTKTYSAAGTDSDGTVTSTKIYWSSKTSGDWSQTPSPLCLGTTGCSGNKTWDTAGQYWVTVNGVDNTGLACSGNPWCKEFPPDIQPEIDCSGWSDCSVGMGDLRSVNVINCSNAWWQVKDGDVLTAGSLKSLLPEGVDYSSGFKAAHFKQA